MQKFRYRILTVFILWFCFAFSIPILNAADYQYIYNGKPVILHASPHLLIVDSSNNTKGLQKKDLQAIGLILDPLSHKTGLRSKGFKLYRRATRQAAGKRDKSLKNLVQKQFSDGDVVTQPVFEQGQALLIPTAEIIVGFDNVKMIDQQEELLAPVIKAQGIKNLKALNDKSLLLTIDNPGDGRCYQVCRRLAKIPGVAFAEPNHLVVMLDEHDNREPINAIEIAIEPQELTSLNSAPNSKSLTTPKDSGNQLMDNGWQLICALDAEAETYPPPGWKLSAGNGKTAAVWGKTNYRAFAGQHSLYCAAYGPDAVKAPGPAPVNMAGYLFSPPLDLSSFNEIYVEVWFYAKNEITINSEGKPEPHDLPLIGIINGKQSTQKILSVIHSGGDCTTDPTTIKGWRKCLFRVPPTYHTENIRVCFLYLADGQNPQEGCYLDNIRILGHKTRQDSSSLSNDTYANAQYELSNHGQVAGIGNQNNDMEVPEAWSLIKISPDLVVAVIDDGVELNHPDLNICAGYQANGTPGGGPLSESSNHGTSVAGNIGAIGYNKLGVIGVAPNVKIMPINGGNSFLERAQAIRLAVAKGAKIINNSWGWVKPPSKEIEAAVNDALAAGVVVLFAAGNGPDRPPFTYEVAFPGNMTETSDVICVGATSLDDKHKSAASSDGQFGWGSSYIGPGPDVCAPGPWSYTTDRTGKAGYNDGSSGVNADYCHDFGGTSSSCPKVTGVVALMLSANPDLTPAEVKKILRKSADDIEDPGDDDKTGAGRVNAYKAVQMALAQTKKQPRKE
ncbi:MAG: S8 family serine peptidase, partial [Deltaproteobacteria bacterium]|nr:S8 family serine peptidase [Candidatus Tharpella sp.]